MSFAPNPTTGTMWVEWQGDLPLEVQVRDLQGRSVGAAFRLMPGRNELTLDVVPGTYVVLGVSGEGVVTTSRIVVQ